MDITIQRCLLYSYTIHAINTFFHIHYKTIIFIINSIITLMTLKLENYTYFAIFILF